MAFIQPKHMKTARKQSFGSQYSSAKAPKNFSKNGILRSPNTGTRRENRYFGKVQILLLGRFGAQRQVRPIARTLMPPSFAKGAHSRSRLQPRPSSGSSACRFSSHGACFSQGCWELLQRSSQTPRSRSAECARSVGFSCSTQVISVFRLGSLGRSWSNCTSWLRCCPTEWFGRLRPF